MHTDLRIEKLTKYRYLDSLDSVRFRESNNFLDENILHAYGDIFITLLQGEGIVVTENQLMDSVGFIKVASELIEAATETKRFDLLNIAIAMYKEKSTFNVAANKIGKVGTDDRNHEDRFVLSGWPKLDEDYSRRLLWSDKFGAKKQIPNNKKYIKHPEEYETAKMLYAILKYFDSDDGNNRKRVAGEAAPIRIRELRQIGTLPNATKEWIFDGLKEEDIQISEGVIKILLRLDNNGVSLSNRSEIYIALTDESNKPRREYFFDIDFPEAVKEAVFVVVDNVYNHSLGVASRADDISSTDKIDPNKNYLSTANSLAVFSILTHRKEKEFILDNPNGVITKNEFNWSKMIQDKKQMIFLYEQLNWKIFFKSMMDGKWRDSLNRYLIALENFIQYENKIEETVVQDDRKMNIKEFVEARQKYKDERRRHLEFSQVVIPSEYFRLTTESLDIQFKALNAEFQIRSAKNFGDEKGSEIQGEVTPKISILPEIAARFALNEFSKQSQLFEDNEQVTMRPPEKLKLIELNNKYFTQRDKDFHAIQGLIGSFID